MMKPKFSVKAPKLSWLWMFCMVFGLGLFSTNDVSAQLVTAGDRNKPGDPLTSVSDKFKVTRAQFRDMTEDEQRNIITLLPPYVIVDLVNYNAAVDPTDPDVIILHVSDFISAMAEMKLLYLSMPLKYKIKED